MKPAPFLYFAPDSLEEALIHLASFGDEAKILAGGQSLGPLLNMRLATPAVLIDINRIAELGRPPRGREGQLVFGSMTRQRDAERSQPVATAAPLLTEALHVVAHPTIRNRGTVGGSIAHADPAAELPAVSVALEAQLAVSSVRGARQIRAADMFLGYFTTAMEADELLTEIQLPALPPRTTCGWMEFAPRHGDFAIVGVAAVVSLSEDLSVQSARLVYSGVSDTPVRAGAAEQAIQGQTLTTDIIQTAGSLAAASVDPVSDLIASSEYRRTLVEVFTRRVLQRAAASSGALDD